MLDKNEGVPRLFRRVPVRVTTSGGRQIDAHAYEWVTSPEHHLYAVERKLQIADYHLNQLFRALENHDAVAIQSNFEGILYATIAAADQFAEALIVGLGLEDGGMQHNLKTALERLPPEYRRLKTRLSRWHDAAILTDVREVRRRATHHHYAKRPGKQVPEVQRVFTISRTGSLRPSRYAGPRDLASYSSACVSHLRKILPLVHEGGEAIEAARQASKGG